MAKLVDAPDSKSGFERSAGSSPAPGTTAKADKVQNLPAFFVARRTSGHPQDDHIGGTACYNCKHEQQAHEDAGSGFRKAHARRAGMGTD